MKNKEYGSDFHYLFEASEIESSLFSKANFSFFFSGRVALYNLLEKGIEKHQWKKVGFPSYYCHEVVEFCRKLPIEVVYYEFNPFTNTQSINWEDEQKNVFINVDFFGIQKLDTSIFQKSIIIDDLTHNLLSLKETKADYCFGSLRKQLPLATGGFCLDNKNDFQFTENVNEFATKIAAQKLSAMYLKSEYLEGKFNHKEIFRKLYLEAEEKFESHKTNSTLPDLIKSQLFSLVPENLIKKSYENLQFVKSKLNPSKKVILKSTHDLTEMGIILLCETNDLRNNLRTNLIENKIYPAVLWPGQLSAVDKDLENRILFIHSDFRYEQEDLEFIIYTINNFINDHE